MKVLLRPLICTPARALWVVRHDIATPDGVVEVVERATRERKSKEELVWTIRSRYLVQILAFGLAPMHSAVRNDCTTKGDCIK